MGTRPDLAQAANALSRFNECPGPEHISAARHVLRYLTGHIDRGITFHGSETVLAQGYPHRDRLIAAADSDLGTPRSTSGIAIMMNGGPILWKCRLQSLTTNSTAWAETNAAAQCIMELRSLIDLATELGAPQDTIRVMEDNAPAIYLSAGGKDTQKSQPFKRLQFFVENEIDNGLAWLNKVPSEHNIADIFTKSMHSAQAFNRLVGVFNGENPELYLGTQIEQLLRTGHIGNSS